MSGNHLVLDELRQRALEAARAANAPRVIEIPGYEEGQTLQVAVRRVDLEPLVLELIGNPVAAAVQERIGEAPPPPTPDEAAELQRRLPNLLDAICRSALVAPTWDEFQEAGGLTFAQKLAIAEAAAGRIRELASFRGD